MGLFDGYFDPDEFEDSGGLPGRLLSLRPELDLDQLGTNTASQVPPNMQVTAATQAPLPPGPVQVPLTMRPTAVDPQLPIDQGIYRSQSPSSSADNFLDEKQMPTTNVGYIEIPAASNPVLGELLRIQEQKKDNMVSGKNFASGIREGSVKYNNDGSLDVTNGTVVTFSYDNGRSRVITITDPHVAHIDKETGEVVIQKSGSDDRL